MIKVNTYDTKTVTEAGETLSEETGLLYDVSDATPEELANLLGLYASDDDDVVAKVLARHEANGTDARDVTWVARPSGAVVECNVITGVVHLVAENLEVADAADLVNALHEAVGK
jgi:hypothetical protein